MAIEGSYAILFWHTNDSSPYGLAGADMTLAVFSAVIAFTTAKEKWK